MRISSSANQRVGLLFLSAWLVFGAHVADAAKRSPLADVPTRAVASPAAGDKVAARRPAVRSLSRSSLPLVFEENVGQADKRVRFLVRRPDYNLFLTQTGMVAVRAGLSGSDRSSDKRRAPVMAAETEAPPSMALHMQLVGASADADVSGEDTLAAKANVFFGGKPADWKKGVALHAAVHYDEVYRDTDLYVLSQSGRLAYSFVLGPRGQAARIRMRFTGPRRSASMARAAWCWCCRTVAAFYTRRQRCLSMSAVVIAA